MNQYEIYSIFGNWKLWRGYWISLAYYCPVILTKCLNRQIEQSYSVACYWLCYFSLLLIKTPNFGVFIWNSKHFDKNIYHAFLAKKKLLILNLLWYKIQYLKHLLWFINYIFEVYIDIFFGKLYTDCIEILKIALMMIYITLVIRGIGTDMCLSHYFLWTILRKKLWKEISMSKIHFIRISWKYE